MKVFIDGQCLPTGEAEGMGQEYTVVVDVPCDKVDKALGNIVGRGVGLTNHKTYTSVGVCSKDPNFEKNLLRIITVCARLEQEEIDTIDHKIIEMQRQKSEYVKKARSV